MKEKRCLTTPSPSPLREKIALWEGRKDGSPVRGSKGRSSGHAGRLFLSSLGKASKNGHGVSGERSDGRSYDENLSIAKKGPDRQKDFDDAKTSPEGYSLEISKDSKTSLKGNKISTLEILQSSEVNSTYGDNCNNISTFEISHTTESAESQGILNVDNTRTPDVYNISISPPLQELIASEDSCSTLSLEESHTRKHCNSSSPLQEPVNIKDSNSPLFQEPLSSKDSSLILPMQETFYHKDSDPPLKEPLTPKDFHSPLSLQISDTSENLNSTPSFGKPLSSNSSNCGSPSPLEEPQVLISSHNFDFSSSLQDDMSSNHENDLQVFTSVLNQHHEISSESPTSLENCSPLQNGKNLSTTLESSSLSSSFPKENNYLVVSPQNQMVTSPSSAFQENKSTPLPSKSHEESLLPSPREYNSSYSTKRETNGYRFSEKYPDEDITEEVSSVESNFRSSSIFRAQTTFNNDDLCFYLENETLKLELEMKEEKIAVLTRELSELSFTGKSEEEVALLKKGKHDLELKVKDQEEELDDLAGQVQMLEAAKIRLEMSIEQTRKENRRELGQRDEEMEDVRVSAQKKIKGLEAQLESEHDERTALVREKHDLERRLVDAHSRSFASVDEDAFHRVKKELKKTKALLKDTQTMLEKTQSEGSNKLLMRQLKTQLEDAEFAKNAAIKARQSVESDFTEMQNQLEEALRAKKDTEDKLGRITKEKSEVQTQLEESEEEVAEVMKKYKATVSQLSLDQVNMSEQAQLIADLEHDKQVLQDRLTELTSKVEVLEGETANIHTQRRLQMKIKELDSKLDLELTTRQRLESQITRLKDQVEKVSSECDSIRMKEMQAVDHGKKMGRQLREAKEDSSSLQQKLTDSTSRKQEIEKQYELAESEIMTLKSDLKLAFKRIEDLQQALQGDLSDSDTEISERHDITSHDMRIRDVVGGASLMTSIREEDGKESYA